MLSMISLPILAHFQKIPRSLKGGKIFKNYKQEHKKTNI